MRIRRMVALLTVPGLAVVGASRSSAQEPERDADLEIAAGATLEPTTAATAPKAATSQLAESDPELLARTDSTTVPVVVKLDYDSIATYDGSVAGLDATSPEVTGSDLTGESAAEVRYEGYIESQEADFASELATAVPEADVVGEPLRTVYGGVRMTVPANRAADVAALDGVVAVQQDALLQPLTDASPEFIGADTLYPTLGGASDAGAGVIFGVLDSGVWPEHPSLADQGNLAAPPPPFGGGARTCDFGDNPLTPDVDVFECNNKLISGEAFIDTYLAVVGGEVYDTARDSNGHGTHTGTTTAGNALDSAEVFGVDRGPLNGIAPGAWVAAYKVCGADGCFQSDSAAAVQQAIYDGVDVINFSISGGTNPATDPVELAFLDAYAAGVFVAASAGNEGPGASTTNHLSPWTTTVGASTQTREFQSTISLTAGNGDTAEFDGVSITSGVADATPVVMSSDPVYGSVLCDAPAAPGSLEGLIIACQRGAIARVEKSYNVSLGGAAGMILYNPSLADVETDNHWVPTVHLADGTDFVAWMQAHGDVTATFTDGTVGDGLADVMAAFSSRGPAGNFIKPDVTAPGVQILAGHTPTPESFVEGPPGEYFQAIAGTSMSSPHVAGAAVLLKALHPEWTPGQIKSALMTTARVDLVKEDLTTPADPLDFGSGHIDLTVAGNPGLTIDASADQMIAFGVDALNAVHLNQPSINAPVMPGRVETTRTVKNVSGQRVRYRVEVTSPEGSSISVDQRSITLAPEQTATLDITIESDAPTAQYFGEIRLVPNRGNLPALHIPVAFVPQQGTVNLMSNCDPAEISQLSLTECAVTAQNNGFNDTVVDLTTTASNRLYIVGADGAEIPWYGGSATLDDVELAGAQIGTPTLQPAGPLGSGYVSLDAFGPPTPIGDEEIVNYTVPPFQYAGKTYSRLGVVSNGYLVVGGGTAEDVDCCNPLLPDPSRPNNILAPFWTDLDGTDSTGYFINVLSDGTYSWIIVEWRLRPWGAGPEVAENVFQTWIGVDGFEDITFNYGPVADPGFPLVVGAENEVGSDGDQLGPDVLPTEDLRIVSTDPVPGDSVSYRVTALGLKRGQAVVQSEMEASTVGGTTIVSSPVRVTKFDWWR